MYVRGIFFIVFEHELLVIEQLKFADLLSSLAWLCISTDHEPPNSIESADMILVWQNGPMV